MTPDVESEVPGMRHARDRAIQSLLLENISVEPFVRARRQRRRIVVWGSIGAVVVAGTVTAGAVIQQAASVSNQEIVHCLDSSELGPNGSYSGASATVAHPSGNGRVHDAVALCTQMWKQGVLNGGYDPLDPTNPSGTVPAALQVCVMKDGSAAVVPSPAEDVCQAIGLAPLDE